MKNRQDKPFAIVAAVLAGALLPCWLCAQTIAVKRGTPERRGKSWVERSEFSVPVKPGGRLVLRTDLSSVVVKAGGLDQLECALTLRAYVGDEAAARKLFQAYQLTVRENQRDAVSVTGTLQGESLRRQPFDGLLEIKVPARFHLDLRTLVGDINLQDPVQGDVRLVTAGGEIVTRDIGGAVHAETAGGSIKLGNIGGPAAVQTAGGGIRVGNVKGDTTLETSGGEIEAGHVEGTLRAETAGGDIILAGASGAVNARTAGGQIRVGECGGAVRAQTAGGSVQVLGARQGVIVRTAGGSIDLLRIQGPVVAATVAGRILAEVIAGAQSFGPARLETALGDVQVLLPPDLSFTVDAVIDQARGHQISSDFPLHIEGSPDELGPAKVRGHGRVNGGGEVLRIRTVAGNVEIRRLDSPAARQLKQPAESRAPKSRRPK